MAAPVNPTLEGRATGLSLNGESFSSGYPGLKPGPQDDGFSHSQPGRVGRRVVPPHPNPLPELKSTDLLCDRAVESAVRGGAAGGR